jgi:hypothetical protein
MAGFLSSEKPNIRIYEYIRSVKKEVVEGLQGHEPGAAEPIAPLLKPVLGS